VKLSVIVPVYNTAQYLKQCIESIINQTYKDMEIILVDDGSTDGSGAICDQLAKDFSNIRVIHQKNKGGLTARCRGLREAIGEYVTFPDSDDWMAEDMYEILMAKAVQEQADIVSMSGYVVVDNNKYFTMEHATMHGTFVKEKNLDLFFSKMMYDIEKESNGVNPSLALKVIKRSIVLQATCDIDDNIIVGDDAAIFYPCCLRAESICIVKGHKYYYRMVNNSVSHYYDIYQFNKISLFSRYLEQEFQKYNVEYNLLEQLKRYLWHIMLSEQIKHIFDIEIVNKWLFPYELVDKHSPIVLYGAGKVGKSYKEQIEKNGYCKIVAWVDQNTNCASNSVILSPQEIKNMEYSKIVIAVKQEAMAMEIACYLTTLGVRKEDVVWQKPIELGVIND